MDVTVEVVSEDTHELSVAAGATYADLLAELEYSPQEVSVLVDGTPVPEDQPVESETIQVVRLIKGG